MVLAKKREQGQDMWKVGGIEEEGNQGQYIGSVSCIYKDS